MVMRIIENREVNEMDIKDMGHKEVKKKNRPPIK